MVVRIVSVGLAFFSLAFVSTHRQAPEAEQQPEWKLSEPAGWQAESRRETIRDEINRLPHHPWAGTYYRGDGLGVNVTLDLALDSGFVFEWRGCLGVYDRNFGGVVESDGRLLLFPELPNVCGAFEGMETELAPVRWGTRRYLVATDAMLDFANAVNAGFEPREGPHGSFLLREGDEQKPVQGWPELPAEFRKYLLAEPIEARIVTLSESREREAVCKWKARVTLVTLDTGSADGAQVGMELHVYDPPRSDTARLIRVTRHRSEAELRQFDPSDEPPAAGWKLSTRPRY